MLIVFLAAFLVLVPQVAHSECVDYGDYLQRMGSVDTPRLEEEVAISGTIGYVVTRDYSGGWTSSLQVIDLANPASPPRIPSPAPRIPLLPARNPSLPPCMTRLTSRITDLFP